MTRPRLIDLFCGAGGCAVGYHRAGFDVTGIDNRPQPRYPYRFVQADALTYPLDGFDAIHASPPCQAYSSAAHYQRSQGAEYPDLVAATREHLDRAGTPWVIENVPGAPLRPDYKICGCTVGLAQIRRERWFETSWRGYDLRPPCHHVEMAITVVGHGTASRSASRRAGLPNPTSAQKRAAMGIDWMTRAELSQAIPPAYTEYIGAQLLDYLTLTERDRFVAPMAIGAGLSVDGQMSVFGGGVA